MTLQHLTGHLTPVEPFDFAKSLAFIGAFPPVRGEQTQGDLTLTKGVMIAGQWVLCLWLESQPGARAIHAPAAHGFKRAQRLGACVNSLAARPFSSSSSLGVML